MSTKKYNIGKQFGIGARIRKIRGELTQKEFASKIGMSVSVISKYESGRIPEPEIMEKIALAGNTTIKWILQGDANLFAEQIAAAGQPPADQPPPVEYERLIARSPQVPARLDAKSADDRHRPDRQLLSDIIALLEDVCEERRLKLSAALKGQIISLLYEVHQDTAKPVSRQTVISFLNLYL